MKIISLIIGLCLLLTPLKAQDSDPFRSLMHTLASVNVSTLMPLKSEETPPQEEYAALEARMFARMNWGPEEIDWFRHTYGTPDNPSMFGMQETYIRDVAALYDQLDAAP